MSNATEVPDDTEFYRDFSRTLGLALEHIAEMVGVDMSHGGDDPWDVVVAVDEFVAESGRGVRLADVQHSVAGRWFDFAAATRTITPSAHERGAKAYFDAIGGGNV